MFLAEKKRLTNRMCDKKERNLLKGKFVWRDTIFVNEGLF